MRNLRVRGNDFGHFLNGTLYKLRGLKRDLIYEAHDIWKGVSERENLDRLINKKEIRFIGLRRSGNHAVINWIKKQEKGFVKFLNNVKPQQSPYRFYYAHFPEEEFRREAWSNFSEKDCLIYSYEDHELDYIAAQKFERKHDYYVGKTAKRYDVILLRDPFNLLASRLKKGYMTVKNPDRSVVDLWISYAREFLGETQHLTQNKIFINYNLWVSNVEYREQIATKLDLDFSDVGFDHVGGYGGGSSFDGIAMRGKAASMNVANRWKHFYDNDEFRLLLNNEELLHYSELIFGHIPGTEFLNRPRVTKLLTFKTRKVYQRIAG